MFGENVTLSVRALVIYVVQSYVLIHHDNKTISIATFEN